ncbi:cell surface protein SprA [candidate division KSB1 bacterium]
MYRNLLKTPRFLFIRIAFFAVLLTLQFGESAFAQIGIHVSPPDSGRAKIGPQLVYPTGLGIGQKGKAYNPDRENFITRTTVLDSLTNAYFISEKISSFDLSIPLAVGREQFRDYYSDVTFNRLWHEATLRTLSATEEEKRSGAGLNIHIPVPFQSEKMQRYLGSDQITLNVDGQVDITGNLIKNDYSQVKDVYRGSDYSFKMEQTQRFNISGKIGDKIDVKVDQNSQNDIDLMNRISLRYTGDSDEIFRSIEAGNVSLSLPGSQFITFSGVNRGLFGFKTVSQVGALQITSVASLERGEKNSRRFKGGATSTKTIIKDYEFLSGRYFFVDNDYRNGYRFDPGSYMPVVQDDVIDEFEVWLSKPQFTYDAESEEGWACVDPGNFFPNDSTKSDQDNIKRNFKRLEANVDYQLNKDLGYFIMRTSVQNGEVLAVAYSTESGKTVGDLYPPSYIDDTTSVFKTKLIRTDNPLPTDKVWALEWRNVYSLGKENINKVGMEMQIVDNRTNERTPQQDNQVTFLEIFGFDRFTTNGPAQPDNLPDVENPYIFDFSRGHIIFPGLEPFNPQKDPFTGETPPLLSEENKVPEIYNQVFPTITEKQRVSKFDIELSYSSASAKFPLNAVNLIEGSEEVYLNGQLLLRGIDYEINYFMGEITILNQNALAQGAEVEVKFESASIFQLAKKTLFGSVLRYDFGGGAYFGAAGMFLNESTIQKRAYIGNEPKKNFVWSVHGGYQRSSVFLTSLVDKLPFIQAIRPTDFSFQGELAQSHPNPNTMSEGSTGDNKGVAYIDDFEGAKRLTYIGVMRRAWTIGSQPTIITSITDSTQEKYQPPMDNRGKLVWYNPYQQVDIKEIFPNKATNSRTRNRVNVLNVKFVKDSKGNIPERPWGSIMTALSPGSFNQTQSKYIEMWVKGDEGTVFVDLGLISEDAIDIGKLNSEDLVVSPFPNGILDDGEDVGLDMIPGIDATSNEIMDDDWYYGEASDDYTNINGTEGNGTGEKVDGTRIPDTEDINGNGSLDTRNDYFQYTIDLGDDNPYVAGNNNNWRLYRIPLSEFSGKVGMPDLSRIEFIRLTFDDLKENQQLTLYNVDIVGNKWLELGIAEDDSLVRRGAYTLSDSLVYVEVVNTEENQEYSSPPGVSGLVDPITQAAAREQSLQFRFVNILPSQSAAIQQTFVKDQNLMHYRYLKMFVYGDPSLVIGDSSYIEFYVQIGRDFKNYYEIRKKLYAGWDKRNEINIDLYDLPNLKTDLYNGYRIVSSDEAWMVRGNPTISAIRQMTVGIKNLDSVPVSGKIWLDEFRISEVDRETGRAYRMNFSVRLSDLINFSAGISRMEADFHNINEKFGSGTNSNNLTLTTSFEVGRIISPLRFLNIPISYSMRQSTSTPKWLQGSDVLFDPKLPEAAIQELVNSSNNFSTSIATSSKSENFFVRNTFDAMNLSYQTQKSSNKDINNEINDRWSSSGNFGYRASIQSPSVKPFVFLGESWLTRHVSNMELFLLPNSITTNLSASQSGSKQKLRARNAKADPTLREISTMKADKRFTTAYSPMQSVTTSFSRSSSHDLKDLKSPLEIFSALFNDSTKLNSSQNFGVNYKPTFLPWLGPSFDYKTDFGISKSRQIKSAGFQASSTRTINTNFSFNLQKLVNIVYKSPASTTTTAGGNVPAVRRAPRRVRGQEQEQQQEETPEEQAEGGRPSVNPLYYVERFAERLADIRMRINKSEQIQLPGLEDAPSQSFQFGFSDDPGVPIIAQLGKNSGSVTNRQSINGNSQLRLFRSFSIQLRFDFTSQESNKGNTKTGSVTHSIVTIKDKRILMPNFGFQIQDIQKLFFLKNLANSISYKFNYDGKKTETWRDLKDNQQSTKFDWNFRPLVNLTMSWKRGVSSTFNLTQSNSLGINKLGAETKSTGTQMSFTTSFQWNRGLTIPLPILGRKTVQNNVQFRMAFSKNSNQRFQKRPGAKEFTVTDDNGNWSIKPQLSYSFTRSVSGGMFFEYRKTNNLRMGEESSKDFGLNVTIRLAG